MDKLEACASQLLLSSCGPQADSKVPTSPIFTIPKASKQSRERVWISKKHPQDLLGRDSPGPAYSPKRQSHPPQSRFGTSEARPPIGGARYPDTSNDLIGVTLNDAALSQHRKQGTASIGSSTRQAQVNAPDMCAFPVGCESPGPVRYKSEGTFGLHRFAHAPKVDQTPPKYTIRIRTKNVSGPKYSGETPAKVGPGSYAQYDGVGAQLLSTKETRPKWSVHKMNRFQTLERESTDAGRLWDGEGDKKLKFSRVFSASPSFGFGTSTRGAAQRAGIIRTSLDRVS